MKYLNWLLILLFAGIFSCGDQKSTEEITNKPQQDPAIEKDEAPADPKPLAKDSLADIQKDRVATAIETDSASKHTEKELADNDTVLTATEEAKRANVFAPVPPELKDQIQYDELPNAAEVGIRPYPNSYVIKINPKTEYRGKTYVTIELGSPDDPEKVLQFYQKWKDNWFFMGGEGIYTFKQEQDKYFRETNTLQILSFNNDLHVEISSLLTIKPQTLIRIYYESK